MGASNVERFIEKAREVHKGEGIDYSKVEYVNNRTKVCLVDPLYGEFWQTPSNHLKGQSHPMRRRCKISVSRRMSTQDVIHRFEEVHKGENLDYSKVVYVNMHTKVCIVDPLYGEFWQEPVVHLKGCGHPKRAIVKNSEAQRYDTATFIELAENIHGKGRYDYSKVEYVRSKEKVCVICHKKDRRGIEHGEFMTSPDLFLQGKACPKCGNQVSVGEDEIYDFLCSLGLKVLRHDKSMLDGLEIDILVPSLSLGIEFNGLRWHSEKFKKDKDYHLFKTQKSMEKGIYLLHVFEDEWNCKKDIIKDKLRHICHCNASLPKIMARNCSVNEISSNSAKIFLEANHIQGFVPSSVYVGCFNGIELIGVASFLRDGDKKWNMTRMSTSILHHCQGVCSKMFKWFVKVYNADEVKTFLDIRWRYGESNVYNLLGFDEECRLRPDYYYTNGFARKHKFLFRKNILIKKYGFNVDMTEYDMAHQLGWSRIWNCGLVKYVWRKKR